MIKTILLIVSIFCCVPPFTPIGIGGLIGWGLLTLLFRAADQGVEEMASAIQEGNPERGGCWLVGIFGFVITGGVLVLVIFFVIASAGRGKF
jgi:hypothetical protein